MARAPKRQKISHSQSGRRWLGRAAVEPDETFPFQMQNDLLSGLLRRRLPCIYAAFRVSRLFVRIGYPGKFLQDARAGFGIQAFAIALLTNLHWRGKVAQNEPAKRLDHRAHIFSRGIVGRNWRTNGDATVLGNLRGDITNPANVDVAMFLRKTEL